QIAFGDLEHEIASTRRMLAAIPSGELGWRPHEKSWTLGALALHVANLLGWGIAILHDPEFDFAKSPPNRSEPESTEAILEEFEANAARFREALAELPDEALFQDWTLRRGAHVILTLPRIAVLRSTILSHIIHHRAQLAVYLRQLDRRVPGLDGPSADEAGSIWPGRAPAGALLPALPSVRQVLPHLAAHLPLDRRQPHDQDQRRQQHAHQQHDQRVR